MASIFIVNSDCNYYSSSQITARMLCAAEPGKYVCTGDAGGDQDEQAHSLSYPFFVRTSGDPGGWWLVDTIRSLVWCLGPMDVMM